jgi:riboflavin synthase alpha subunit
MGKSAKIHKRTVRPPQKTSISNLNKNSPCSPFSFSFQLLPPYLPTIQKKKTSNHGTGTGTSTTPKSAVLPVAAAAQATTTTSVAVASAAKNAKLKNKSKRVAKLRRSVAGSSSSGGHHVLGGADYVDIVMGSRRREREEAMKLPRDSADVV